MIIKSRLVLNDSSGIQLYSMVFISVRTSMYKRILRNSLKAGFIKIKDIWKITTYKKYFQNENEYNGKKNKSKETANTK